MSIEPFRVEVAQSVLDDLNARLSSFRPVPSDGVGVHDWEAGTNPAYLAELIEYWRHGFDWRAEEARINRLDHFRSSVDGVNIHFVHQRGRGPRPLPLVLTHGYPDSFLRFSKIISMLADPGAHGGDPRDAFDVVVPSLPGYAFSDPLLKSGGAFGVADIWDHLMTKELGYAHYGAHGGDWGSTVTEHLARSHASSMVGVHLTDVPFWHAFRKPTDLSRAEKEFFQANDKFQTQEAAYALIQGTRPQTLADGLNDSPAGLAAWIVEKFQRWSDCRGDIETRFSKDDLLSNIMLYWSTQTIGTSFLPYFDFVHAGAGRWMMEMVKGWVGSSSVPAGFAIFPRDITQPPREYASRFFNVQRWTDMPRGGHFAAFEEPELLAEDIRTFFRPIRTGAEAGSVVREREAVS